MLFLRRRSRSASTSIPLPKVQNSPSDMENGSYRDRSSVHKVLTSEMRAKVVTMLRRIGSKSLPPTRSDISTDDSEVIIRISQRTAVHFILGPQRREETASPNLRHNTSHRSVGTDKSATTVLRKVDKEGSSNVSEMIFAIERMEEEV